MDRKGAIGAVSFPARGATTRCALSPDGGRLAAISVEKGEKLSLLFGDLARGTLTRSTAEGIFQGLAWTPDGKRVAFGFSPGWKSPDSASSGRAPTEAPRPSASRARRRSSKSAPTSFSPDGSLLLVKVYNYADANSATCAGTSSCFRSSGERKLRPFLQTKFDVCKQRSVLARRPLGRVPVLGRVGGAVEVFVRPFPGPGPKMADLDRRGAGAALVPERA